MLTFYFYLCIHIYIYIYIASRTCFAGRFAVLFHCLIV